VIRLAAALLLGVLGTAEDWRGVEFTQSHFDALARLVSEKMLDPPQVGSDREQKAWRRAAEMALWSLEPSVELLPQSYLDHLRGLEPPCKPQQPPQPLPCQGRNVPGLVLSRESLAQRDPSALQLAWQGWLQHQRFGRQELLCSIAWLDAELPRGDQRRPGLWMAWVNAASGWLKALDSNADVIAGRFWEAESEPEHVAPRADPGMILAKCADPQPTTPWNCCVTDIRRDSPAWRADVRVGDRVGPLADGTDLCAAPLRLLGDDREALVLPLWSRRTAKTRSLTLLRDRAVVRDVEARVLAKTSVHLLVRDFVRGTAERAVQATAAALKPLRGKARVPTAILLDLRGNRGGVLDESVALADWLLQSGAIVQTRWRERTELRQAVDGPRELRAPLVVLMDRRCGSACEVLAGALQDHQRAPLLGSRSFGKASMQRVQKTNQMANFYVKYTIGKYLTPAGRDIDGRGLEPDIALPADPTSAHAIAADNPWHAGQKCVQSSGSAQRRLAADVAPRQRPDPWLEMAVDWLACLSKR
jgi:C-terminal peptidase prc